MPQELFWYNATHFRHPRTSGPILAPDLPPSSSSYLSVCAPSQTPIVNCRAMNRISRCPSSAAAKKSASTSMGTGSHIYFLHSRPFPFPCFVSIVKGRMLTYIHTIIHSKLTLYNTQEFWGHFVSLHTTQPRCPSKKNSLVNSQAWAFFLLSTLTYTEGEQEMKDFRLLHA